MSQPSLLDPLYCQEDHWEEEEPLLLLQPHHPESEHRRLLIWDGGEEEWEELFSSLASKEIETHPNPSPPDTGNDDSYLFSARREAVQWVSTASAHHGFSALTVVLAVNYLDRCFLPTNSGGGAALRLQEDKPWMAQLSAVACLSLAAKVEETHVPLLLDLQVEETRYVFEARTIKRMELLVLSTLGWRLNPVTPLSFTHHILSRLGFPTTTTTHLWDLLRSCQAILLSVIADWRWVQYPASVLAGVTLLHAIGQMEPGIAGSLEYETHRLMGLLSIPKERLEKCYQLILESMDGLCGGNKRKYLSPPSPSGVIGSCFSCDSSSSDSWAMWSSSVSSSPEPPPFKRPNLE